MSPTWRRALSACVLAGFLPLATTGCFGNFELTKKVWKFNKESSQDKWVQEIVFLVLAILPVYGGASFLDAVVFNSIEFWTGENPVLTADGATRVVPGPNGEQLTMRRIDGDTLDIRDATGAILRVRAAVITAFIAGPSLGPMTLALTCS